MSILIKGVEMPKEGQAMNIEIDFDGKTIVYFYGDIPGHEDEDIKIELWRRIGEVIPVPTPHGRLIDADELMKYELQATLFPKGREENIDVWTNAVAIGDIMSAPTVLEAEE